MIKMSAAIVVTHSMFKATRYRPTAFFVVSLYERDERLLQTGRDQDQEVAGQSRGCCVDQGNFFSLSHFNA